MLMQLFPGVGDYHGRYLAGIFPRCSHLLEPFGLIFNPSDYRREQPAINAPLTAAPRSTLQSTADRRLALLLAKPGRRPPRDLVAELHQEHRCGYMGVALVVSPSQSGELYHVAAAQASMTPPKVLCLVDGKARRPVRVVGQRAAPDPLLADASKATEAHEPIGLVCHRDEPLGFAYEPGVGDAPISLGASRLGLMYTTGHKTILPLVWGLFGSGRVGRTPFFFAHALES
jgi:hypothetical protein